MGVIPLKVGRGDHAAAGRRWGDPRVPRLWVSVPWLGQERSRGVCGAWGVLLCWERVGKEGWRRMERASKGEGGCGKVPARERGEAEPPGSTGGGQVPVSLADTGPPPALASQPPGCRVDLPPPHYFCSTAPTGLPAPPPTEGVAVTPAVTVPAPYHRLEGALGPRSRSDSVERRSDPPATSAEDYHEADGARSRTRAVENQYSFY